MGKYQPHSTKALYTAKLHSSVLSNVLRPKTAELWSNYPRRPTAAGALLLVSGVIVGDEEEDDDNDGEFVADDD